MSAFFYYELFFPWITVRLDDLKTETEYSLSRPALSQFQSLTIRKSTNLMKFERVVRRIWKLQSCQRVGQAAAFSHPQRQDYCLKVSSEALIPVNLISWSLTRLDIGFDVKVES